MYHAIISASNHPDPYNPYVGLFNYRSIKSLSDLGIEIDAVAPRPFAPSFGPYSEYSNIPDRYTYESHTIHYPRFLYLLPQRVFRYTLSARSASKRIPEYISRSFETPDVVHAGHIHYDGSAVLPYCKDNDIPFTVMGRGKTLNNYQDLSTIAQSKVDKVLTECAMVLCVSESLADIAKELTDPSKVAVLPNGADPNRYPTTCKQQIRDELGISPQTTLILFCGGFTKRKGIYEIIDVLNNLQTDQDIQFVFIGHYGDLRGRLISALGQSSHKSYRVLWKVPPLALRRWFTVADILLLPSHAEGRPNVIYEAMASETSIIASNVSGIPEQVNDGETGVLIPPKAPGELKVAIESLISDRDRRDRMGEKGKERLVKNGWTWNAHAEQLCDHHTSLFE